MSPARRFFILLLDAFNPRRGELAAHRRLLEDEVAAAICPPTSHVV
jgi:hypothetical protein